MIPNERKALDLLKTAQTKNFELLDFRIYGANAKGIYVN